MPPEPIPNETLILGEHRRVLDERFRVSIPLELVECWGEERSDCVLVKERPGCVSLWKATEWKSQLESGVNVIRSKLSAGRLSSQATEVQLLGRLLSTRHKNVQLTGRARLLIPEGFREFLGAEAGQEVLIIGAAICVEIWQVTAWRDCLKEEIPQFEQVLRQLIG